MFQGLIPFSGFCSDGSAVQQRRIAAVFIQVQRNAVCGIELVQTTDLKGREGALLRKWVQSTAVSCTRMINFQSSSIRKHKERRRKRHNGKKNKICSDFKALKDTGKTFRYNVGAFPHFLCSICSVSQYQDCYVTGMNSDVAAKIVLLFLRKTKVRTNCEVLRCRECISLRRFISRVSKKMRKQRENIKAVK